MPVHGDGCGAWPGYVSKAAKWRVDVMGREARCMAACFSLEVQVIGPVLRPEGGVVPGVCFFKVPKTVILRPTACEVKIVCARALCAMPAMCGPAGH